MSDTREQSIEAILELQSNFHDSGNLHPPVLEKIVELCRDKGELVSAETGCGLSTLILSRMARRHYSFTVPYGDSMHIVKTSPHLDAARVTFVVGPSQMTLPRFQFNDALDFVLIDGAHGYPFPEMDYMFTYPHIKHGGVLAIDDIHIPTIRRLYEFLLVDDMWEHVGDVSYTAFFRRTAAKLFNPIGDDWYLQKFNQTHFPHPEWLEGALGVKWWEKK